MTSGRPSKHKLQSPTTPTGLGFRHDTTVRPDRPRYVKGATGTLYITGDAAADELLNNNPLALLVGMLLDQQIQ